MLKDIPVGILHALLQGMSRIPRKYVTYDGCYFHITWQTTDKKWYLKSDRRKRYLYDLLFRFRRRYGVDIYSYCFMSNHPHFTGKCRTAKELSQFMHVVNTLFARRVNSEEKRTGQVIQDRYVSVVIEDDTHMLSEIRYNDLNPVRGKIARHPGKYKYSSYHYYASGVDDPLITPFPTYESMGYSAKNRQIAYQELFKDCELSKRRSCCLFIGSVGWVLKNKENIKKLQKVDRDKKIGKSPP